MRASGTAPLDHARLVVHARVPMGDELQDEILGLLDTSEARAKGFVTMGEIVDRLVVQGHEEAEVERHIWSLLEQRRLTPNGYVCRVMKRRLEDGMIHRRAYEFTLVAWDPELDKQLDLHGSRGPER